MDRLSRLEQRPLPDGGTLLVARTFGQRLLGLAGLRAMPADCALLIPGCESVHTAWMRFSIDAAFLDSSGAVVRVAEGVRPWRMAWCREAAAVVETRAGQAAALGFRVSASRSPAGPRPAARRA
ncbi:MAG: DUF192 domain-containing protein [Thermoleophilaceae bacterium]